MFSCVDNILVRKQFSESVVIVSNLGGYAVNQRLLYGGRGNPFIKREDTYWAKHVRQRYYTPHLAMVSK
jgi:hypothetical protein